MQYSIIIPVYNAEATLRRCLSSIVRQPFSDYELLLINDGSTDGSDTICREYADAYPQIRYVAKENGGVSSARNLGLEQASGTYILFVDSDDYVAEDYFAVIDQELTQCPPDLLMFGAVNTGVEKRTRITGTYRETEELNIARRIADAMQRYLFSSLWNKAFFRQIIEQNNIRFENELSIGEDQVFLFNYAMHVQSVTSIENILYNVDVSGGNSLSRKARSYLTQQLMEVNHQMYAAYCGSLHSPEAARYYETALSWMTYRSVYSSCKELLKFQYTPTQRRREIRKICDRYRAERIEPVGWKCRVIALPVQMKWSLLIDWLICYQNK